VRKLRQSGPKTTSQVYKIQKEPQIKQRQKEIQTGYLPWKGKANERES
jgi:hypothetical protein